MTRAAGTAGAAAWAGAGFARGGGCALAALLAGCAATPPAPPEPPSYLALGEPGWTLEITPGGLNYSGDRGAARIAEAHGGRRADAAGRRYAGRRIAVVISPGPCADPLSGRRYAETVRLTVDGRPLGGCGGALLPPADLAGSLWRVSHVGGVAVADIAATDMRFAATRLSGSAGCNRFSADYRVDGDRLVTGALTATKMACAGAAAAQERALFALLAGPVTLAWDADGGLRLRGPGGAGARLAPRP